VIPLELGIFGIVANENNYQEIAEYLGLGTGGLLFLKYFLPLLS